MNGAGTSEHLRARVQSTSVALDDTDDIEHKKEINPDTYTDTDVESVQGHERSGHEWTFASAGSLYFAKQAGQVWIEN